MKIPEGDISRRALLRGAAGGAALVAAGRLPAWAKPVAAAAGVRKPGSVPFAMRYWDDRDLPFTYSLVRHFPLGQRYFCSVLAQTYPNRRFLFSGTASGTIATNADTFTIPAKNGTIWDRLDAHDISYA